MVLCYKITHKYKELLPFLLYLMIASIYYENGYFSSNFCKIQKCSRKSKDCHSMLLTLRLHLLCITFSNGFRVGTRIRSLYFTELKAISTPNSIRKKFRNSGNPYDMRILNLFFIHVDSHVRFSQKKLKL